MSEQNQGPTPQGQGSPNQERKGNSLSAFIQNNLAWLIPLGILLLIFLIPGTRHWISNTVRCATVNSKEGAARVDACRQYLSRESFAKAPCYGDCMEAVDYENARQVRNYEVLRAYVDKYDNQAGTAHFQEIFNLLDSVICANLGQNAEAKAATCQAYKDEFGRAGKCYYECHAFLDEYDCEAALKDPNREEAYRRYIDKYGSEGKCYEEFRQALEKGVPATMDKAGERAPATTSKGTPPATAQSPKKKATPASTRTCQTFTVGSQKFKAIKLGPLWWTAENMNKNGFVTWQQARTMCPTGWRLPCTQEVEHLTREFYSNPDKAYTYLTSQDPRNCEFNMEFTGFQWMPGMATFNAGEVAGFWCFNEDTPNGPQAGSFLFKKSNRSIETLLTTDKTMGLNCRCVKESKDYKNSSLRFMPCVGMP
ncbi:MAG: hypothetical protein J5I94_19145 [Phaeodactylibacter sp.]|nr:hypothetical protein [Phaeodactylibacter sp.]